MPGSAPWKFSNLTTKFGSPITNFVSWSSAMTRVLTFNHPLPIIPIPHTIVQVMAAVLRVPCEHLGHPPQTSMIMSHLSPQCLPFQYIPWVAPWVPILHGRSSEFQSLQADEISSSLGRQLMPLSNIIWYITDKRGHLVNAFWFDIGPSHLFLWVTWSHTFPTSLRYHE